MRDIHVKEIFREMMQEPWLEDAPLALIRDVGLRSIQRIFKLIKKPDRWIFMRGFPITSVRELHDGQRFVVEFYDIDETRFLTREYKERMKSYEDYNIDCVNIGDGRKKAIFYKGRGRDRIRIQDRRHRRLERNKRFRAERAKKADT